jgi:hypothetical protein
MARQDMYLHRPPFCLDGASDPVSVVFNVGIIQRAACWHVYLALVEAEANGLQKKLQYFKCGGWTKEECEMLLDQLCSPTNGKK